MQVMSLLSLCPGKPLSYFLFPLFPFISVVWIYVAYLVQEPCIHQIKSIIACNTLYTIMQQANNSTVYRILLVKTTQRRPYLSGRIRGNFRWLYMTK